MIMMKFQLKSLTNKKKQITKKQGNKLNGG